MAVDQQRAQMAHLLRRAGFSAAPAELDEYLALGYGGAVDRLLNYEQVPETSPGYTPTDLNDQGRPRPRELQLWWLNRMLGTKRPLQEKMTLFWHGHFATADSKVNDIVLMYNQNQLFRDNALGKFEPMLSAVSKDPAMMKWLDSQTNRRGSPNENYAREIMELFTIGIGNFTEQDVKEGARALTGWTFQREAAVGEFVPRRFDDGAKTYLGRTGKLGFNDVMSMLAGSPLTAKLMATRLARFFIADSPDGGTVDQIAGTFSASGGDMRQVMRSVLTADAFTNPANFRSKIASPTEWVVGNLKLLGAKAADERTLGAMAGMGQALFNPPNVAGWPGGRAWLNTDTIFSRLNYANRLATERQTDSAAYVDVAALLKGRSDPVGTLVDLLTDGRLPDGQQTVLRDYLGAGAKAVDNKLRGLLHLLLSAPSAHLN